jgi:predicted porin
MLRLSRLGAIAAIALGLTVASAWGQDTRQAPQGAPQEESPPTETRPPLIVPAPNVTSYPLEFLGLLAPPPGAATFVPSLSVTEEYIDNVFFSSTNKEWDLVTHLTPAASLFLNRQRYRLIAAVSTSADLYARESNLDNGLGSANLALAGDYYATRDLTLRISDGLTVDRNTSATGTFSVGRQLSLTNTLSPGLRWQITPRNAIDATVTYGILRFFGTGFGADSDTYEFQARYDHSFTQRFSVNLGYRFTGLHTAGSEDSITHTPTVGLGYRLTPALSVDVSGGPAVTIIGGNSFLTPAGNVSVTQVLRGGTINLQYNRGVSAAGGFGGTTDAQTAVATVAMPTWIRDLIFLVSPSWNKSESVDTHVASQVDVESFRVELGLAYRLSRYASIFAGYDYIRQRTGQSSTNQVNADQNRVRIGLQVGYPFSLD